MKNKNYSVHSRDQGVRETTASKISEDNYWTYSPCPQEQDFTSCFFHIMSQTISVFKTQYFIINNSVQEITFYRTNPWVWFHKIIINKEIIIKTMAITQGKQIWLD